MHVSECVWSVCVCVCLFVCVLTLLSQLYLAFDPSVVPTRDLDTFILVLPAYIGDECVMIATQTHTHTRHT